MKAQNRYTKHGKRRVIERVDTSQKVNSLARIVSKNGKSKDMYNGIFHQYLVSKSSNRARVKVYKDNIYIFSKNTKRLITTYPVPDKYLPVEQFEISENILSLAFSVKMYMNKPVIIKLKDESILKGYIDGEYNPEVISKFILITENESILIDLEDVLNIEVDIELLSEEIKESVSV